MKMSLFYKLVLLSLIAGYDFSGGLLAQSNASNVIQVKKCKDFEITGNGGSTLWGITEWINITSPKSE